MLTIEGLAMAGLGPPGTAPAAQGKVGPVDFAALLAVATDTPAPLTEAMPGLAPGNFGLAAAGLVGDVPGSAALPVAVSTAASSAPNSSAAPGALSSRGLLSDGLPPPTIDVATWPDRSSEAAPLPEDLAETSLLAATLGASVVTTVPVPVAPEPATATAAGRTTPGEVAAVTAGAMGPSGPTSPQDSIYPITGDIAGVGTTPEAPAPLAASSAPQGIEAARATAPEPTATDPAAPPSADAAPGQRPEERLGALLAALDPQDRSAFAREWNRRGGRAGVGPADATDSLVAPSTNTMAQAAGDAVQSTPLAGGALDDLNAVAPALPDGVPSIVSATEPPASSAALGGLDASTARDVDIEFMASTEVPATSDSSAVTTASEVAAVEMASVEATLADSATPQPVRAARSDEPPGALATSATPQSLDTRDQATLRARLTDSVLEATRSGDAALRLVLSPPELGHLDIRVERGEQGMRVEFITSTSGAADLIQQQLPGLVAGLEARSVRVDHAEVRQAATSTTGGFNAGTDARQPGGDASGGRSPWERPDWSDTARLTQGAPTSTATSRPGSGLLDMVA